MKNYLSFGGGVNSVAMMLLLLDEDIEFEAVFVDHGTDWPETYEYFEMFQGWLEKKGYKKITVLKPKEGTLYDYCYEKSMVPCIYPRWCTRQFKISIIHKYYEKPCFQFIGIDYSEKHRAKINIEKEVENRYPLIEFEIDRDKCKQIIKKYNLTVPIKSGCFICPYQRTDQWKDLRKKHPDLFCKAEILEKRNIEYRKSKGKKIMYLSPKKIPLKSLIDENQKFLFKEDEYPPCNCML